MLLLLKALVLGIVEGLTEFLPVSSTGHLIIAGAIVDYPEAQRATFEIFIQLGSICAVFWHFRAPLWDLLQRAPRDTAARDLLLKVLVAFVPAAAIGFLFHHQIEARLFNVYTVAAALIGGGLVILAVERRSFRPTVTALERTTWRDALGIGLAQVASLFPGVSRAAATIIGGMLCGLSRPIATEFSFYLALPTLTAASLYSLLKALPTLHASDAASLTVGFVAAFVSALIVIRSFIVYVQSHNFRVFGTYRIAVGILIFAVARWF